MHSTNDRSAFKNISLEILFKKTALYLLPAKRSLKRKNDFTYRGITLHFGKSFFHLLNRIFAVYDRS